MSPLRAVAYRAWDAGPAGVVVRTGDGSTQSVSRRAAAVLQAARRWTPAEELVRIGGEAVVDALRRDGLLEDPERVWRRRQPTTVPAAVPAIAAIAVPTRGPSPALARLLDGLALERARGGPPVWVLVDDPDPAAADAVRRLAPDVVVIGAEERAALLLALEEAGVDAASARASLVAPPGPWRIGALRNLGLLLGLDRLSLSIDDDVTTGIVGGAWGSWRLVAGGDPTQARLYPHRERGWPREMDPARAAVHARALGRRAMDLLAGRDADTTGASATLDDLVRDGQDVVVSSLGLAGDAGASRATTLLAIAGGQRAEVLGQLDAILAARTVLRRAPVPTITDAPVLMAPCLGLDGRALLPPFFTAHRNTDGLWASCLLRWVRSGLAAHLPAAVVHDPPQRKGFAVEELAAHAVAFRTSDLLLMWLGRHPPAGGTPRARLAALAARVHELAEDPLLDETVDDLVRAWLAGMAGQVAGWRHQAPAPILALDAAASAISAALERPPPPLEHADGDALDAPGLRADLRRFARSLDGWPELRVAMRQVRGSIPGIPD